MKASLASRGVYRAERASALSGVPQSTMYEWARHRLIVPSISDTKVKLWSWTDLVALRAVYWLRHPTDVKRSPTPMPQVRSILRRLQMEASSAGEVLSTDGVLLSVDGEGRPYLDSGYIVVAGASGALQIADRALVTNLLDRFSTEADMVGPDLITPRPHIRIVPGKLSGEPHVEGTRIETRVLSALERRGFDAVSIARLYPDLSVPDILDALSLEAQLRRNLRAA